MEVGVRILELRKQQGLTTNKLANLCGLSQSFVRSVELGEKGITVENLRLLCDVLHISLRDFFDTSDELDDHLDRELKTCISLLNRERKEALLTLLTNQ